MEIQLADARKILELQLGGYMVLRDQYHAEIGTSVHQYLATNQSSTDFKLAMLAIIALFFTHVGDDAWFGAGNEGTMDGDISDWLTSQQSAEAQYVSGLSATLGALRKDPSTMAIAGQIATERADGYTRTLDRIYANVKVASAKQTMLTFGGESGIDSCIDCKTYFGQRHTASWWWMMDAIPPNRNFADGGFRCMHFLHDDKGYLFTF